MESLDDVLVVCMLLFFIGSYFGIDAYWSKYTGLCLELSPCFMRLLYVHNLAT